MMSRLAAVVLSLLSVLAAVSAQTCQTPPTCSSSPAGVPSPWFNLDFSTNPGASGFAWEQTEPSDSSCTFQHNGIAKFTGTSSQYVDLNLATGANSAGRALPGLIGGAGSGSLADGTMGWSFEWTFKSAVGSTQGNAKIFAIGAGAAIWNIFGGPDGSGNIDVFGVYGGLGNYNNGQSGIANIINPVVASQWYHVVAVVQHLVANVTAQPNAAAYFLYVNGQLLNYSGTSIYLNSLAIQPQVRQMAYLGRSDWTADPYWTGLLDTFRIYDRALTQTQVTTLYGGEMGGCTVPTSSVGTVVSYPNILPRSASATPSPIYSLTFDTNPCTSGACTYGWEQVSSTDSTALQATHRGMLTLNLNAATTTQWADLNAASGSSSVTSTPFPLLGGVPSTSVPGWSFEVTLKLGIVESWAKIFDFGVARSNAGQCNNDIVLGWDSNNAQLQFEICDSAAHQLQTGDAMGFLQPTLWYHMVVVAQPVTQPTVNGLATYFSYVNGKLYTAEAGFPMIAAVARTAAWIGRSGWYVNGDLNFSAEIDTFNIYNVALSDTQVTALASAALGSGNPTVPSTCSAAVTCASSPASVPTPFYNLDFANNPGASGYGWEATDAGDATCPYQHRGIAMFTGSSSQYVNLNTTTGPNSAGVALPITFGGAGGGSLADGTMGWSFEFTFRSTSAQAGNAKIFSIGAGQAVWNIFGGPDGSGNIDVFGVYGGSGTYNNGASGIANIINPVTSTQWYHAVAVVQHLVADVTAQPNAAAYFLYVNGQLINYNGVSTYLNSLAVQSQARPLAYLGRSDWPADPYWTGLIDTFRIYDRALTQTQVTSLYQGGMGGCTVPFTSNVGTVVSSPNILPRATSPTSAPTPFYSLTFDTNPCTVAAGCTYGWEQVSGTDSTALQATHRGMLTLNGADQWADLMATSGPTSVKSTALGQLGTPSGSTQGWSFEVTAKMGVVESWAKIFDLGATRTTQSQCNNDIVLGWDASNAQLQFELCDSAAHQFQTGDAMGFLSQGLWYHMVVVSVPVTPANGLANYFSYINGKLYTVESNFPTIANVARSQAWLGRSGWYVNGDANFSAEIDTFNIYQAALTDAQVSTLATAALGSNNPTTVPSCSAKPTCQSSPATVPTAWYELTFASATSGATGYGWEQTDAGDATCAYQHQGVAMFGGGLSSGGQWADMSATTGPNGVARAIPGVIGGAGSGSLNDGTQGWSFELTFRSNRETSNAKFFSIGAGIATWNIFAGPDGGATGSNFGVYGGLGDYRNAQSGIVEFVNPINTNQWYHVVAVVQQITSNSSFAAGSTYFVYVNGQLLNYTGVGVTLNSHLILAQPRPQAYLARSNWPADPYWSGLIDTFRIYDRALTQAQVTSLYLGEMGGCSVPTGSSGSGGSSPNLLPRTADSYVTPFYSLNFATDPRTVTGQTYTYGWESVSSTDNSTTQGKRTGMLTLDGKLQYVDLNAVSGPAAASTTALPVIGGGTAGWSFEVIAKPGPVTNWAKLIDIGSTRGATTGASCVNDITLGWDGSNVQWQFDVCDGNNHEFQTGDAVGNIQNGQWYHILAVIAPSSTGTGNGLANYFTYVNGQLYTAEANLMYPPAVVRQNAWLGRSGWGVNNDANFSVELDTFNIYSTAISDVQAIKLYQQNFLGQQVAWGTGGGGSSDSSKSGLSGGAIAGIVIGSVVGALVLLALCWIFICAGAARGGKKSGSTGYDTHNDREVSHVTNESETGGREGVELA